ncbi:RadC family protein [Cellvibrio polysaccharolyticus]|uniref:JAB domain-containing protein n=1 Tax=Cellvibrio polysaccharolyticus TaxID=2082724 RepID=A0A928V0N1_9GAMM|nr:DNA repair protein RadC [Cellvibrio polysaccharolyticus]MBE8715593.1 JAB domain-containing protein [Cellvibrio polysaccharolyticus]
MAITDWPAAERPREKLLLTGAEALSDAELLAIFLRIGCAGKSAVDLARDLLVTYGGLRPLLEATQEDFCRGQGLGTAKYAQLQAVLEMAKRHLSASLQERDLLTSPTLVRQYLSTRLRHQQREVFAILFLDSQNRLLAYDELFYGTLDGASVYPREVVKATLAHNAASLILAHNHPSGMPEPSDADIRLTDRLQKALTLIDVRILDHMIVGNDEVLSFAERGLLPP